MKTEVKMSYLLFVLAFFGYALKFGLNIFLARHLTASLYGDYSVAIKLLTILITLSLFGTNIGANRFFVKYLQSDDKEMATNYLAWNVKLLGFTFLITFFIALLAFGIMLLLHYFNIKDINQYHLATYTLWLVPFAAIAKLLSSFLLSGNRILLSMLYNNPFKYLIEIVLFALVVIFIDPELNNTSIVIVLFVSFVLISIISNFSMNEEILQLLRLGIKKYKNINLSQMEWLQTSSRLISNNIIFAVTCSIDLIAVELFSSNEAHVGYYAAILTIISLLWLVPGSVYQGLKPQFTILLNDELGHQELQQKLNMTNLIAFILIVVLMLLIIFFGKSILAYFGPQYVQVYSELIVLIVATACSCLARIAPSLLVYAGYESIVLRWSIIELGLMVVLTMPATYWFDIKGTAFATAFVLILKPFFTILIARKKLGLRPLSIF
ncbi:polysaccharide biosynthesis C-terminal domain-containing protein [Legionella yabuuchiae]|uniref:polysaccharide biosynthesis C-terminal domain-containing protein n=1 Tax=Legionella yabuuchiae TaxID=376727 RepID=UPI001055DF60|nr:polysaccharide biosynthesis C-terminal domain-containing protein [Legionella yabuuchiae]